MGKHFNISYFYVSIIADAIRRDQTWYYNRGIF